MVFVHWDQRKFVTVQIALPSISRYSIFDLAIDHRKRLLLSWFVFIDSTRQIGSSFRRFYHALDSTPGGSSFSTRSSIFPENVPECYSLYHLVLFIFRIILLDVLW